MLSSSPPPAGPQELHHAHAGGRGAVGPGPLHHHHHPQDPGADALPQRRADGRRRRDQRVRGRGLHPSRLAQAPGASLGSGVTTPHPRPPDYSPALNPVKHCAIECASSLFLAPSHLCPVLSSTCRSHTRGQIYQLREDPVALQRPSLSVSPGCGGEGGLERLVSVLGWCVIALRVTHISNSLKRNVTEIFGGRG